MRLAIALYAFGLLAYPVWGLVSPETYAAELEEFSQAATAAASQIQMAAGIHWLKNAYLAFACLLLARYLGSRERRGDLTRAGALLMAWPVILLIYQVLAQVAMSSDPQDLDLQIHIRGEWLLYSVLGLALIGISRDPRIIDRDTASE